jgi:hypothetical protein
MAEFVALPVKLFPGTAGVPPAFVECKLLEKFSGDLG